MLHRLRWIINLNSRTYVINDLKFSAKLQKDELFITPTGVDKMEAVGLFPLSSYLNHSCDSNVGVKQPSYRGDILSFRAIKPIKAGDELTISYWEDPDVTTRRKELWRNFYFKCSCVRCIREAHNAH